MTGRDSYGDPILVESAATQIARLAAQLRDREDANLVLVQRLATVERELKEANDRVPALESAVEGYSRKIEQLVGEVAAARGISVVEYLSLPGWQCSSCRCFNGEAKEPLLVCRACGTERPA